MLIDGTAVIMLVAGCTSQINQTESNILLAET